MPIYRPATKTRIAAGDPSPARLLLRHAALAVLLVHWGIGWGTVSAASAGSAQASIPVRGVVRAMRQATIATDAPLRAVDLPLRESDRFKRGDVLAVFDCRRQQADLDAAIAVQREVALTLESNIHLDRFQAIGKNDVGIARARADKSRAEIAGLESRMDECRLIAPFDGRITELSLRTHERTVPQRPFISIIDDGKLEIELIAPAANLIELAPGARFVFRVDELGGRALEASVDRLGAAVDPVSKTVKVIGAIKTQDAEVLAGMSGTASFNVEGRP